MIHKVVIKICVLSIILIHAGCFASSVASDAEFAQSHVRIKEQLIAEGEDQRRVELGLEPGAPIPEPKVIPMRYPANQCFYFKDRHELVRRTDVFSTGQVVRFSEDENASVNNKSWIVVTDGSAASFRNESFTDATRTLILQEKIRVTCCCFSRLKNGATKTINAKQKIDRVSKKTQEETITFE